MAENLANEHTSVQADAVENALKQKVREDLLEKSVEPSSRFEYIST